MDTQPKFQPDLHGRARTPEAREEAFQAFLRGRVEYDQAIKDAGDTPWHCWDTHSRRELFMRRYK